MINSSCLFPGVPRVESPVFGAEIERMELSAMERDIAIALNRDGFAVFDFPDTLLDERIGRIRNELAPHLNLEDGDPDSNKLLGPGRIQDAWQFSADVRAIAANTEVLYMLSRLYGRRAFPFQTLNFPAGTQQHLHTDAVHFSSIPPRFMCGVWLAMEDVAADAGPLCYVPGSHKWPLLDNSMIGRRGMGEELESAQVPYHEAWCALMGEHNIPISHFLARKGQALIWCANLLHGGSVQNNPALTRWSQVTHYYFDDCIYYTPAHSDEYLGRLALRKLVSIADGTAKPNLYLGEEILAPPSTRQVRPAQPISEVGPSHLASMAAQITKIVRMGCSVMLKELRRWLRQKLAPVGYVDAMAGSRVAGWAMGRGPLTVEAWLGTQCIARSQPEIHRPDVAHAYQGRPRASTSGFAFDLPAGALPSDALAELRIIARPTRAWLPSKTIGSFHLAGDGLEDRLGNAADSAIRGPFPKPVIDAIAAVWPEDCTDLDAVTGQHRFVTRLGQIMATPGLNAIPAFCDYARYLTVTLAHCRFVERHFPAMNRNAEAGASDFSCKPNSIRELFAIIHQLYVLDSWGIPGDFAEFGCFKGYSSAMLSFACAQLGRKMHIFDSFEGLPEAPGSGYEAGQYAGAIGEVRNHITRFGAVDSVTFHKGFFADTFRNWRSPPLMCLWMDVDLEVSARDLMVAIEALDPRATLFSHECTAGIFQDGRIVASPSPDNPIPPLLARHEELGRPLTGQYIAGYTGAFWPREGGTSVIDTEVLLELLRNLA